MYITKMDMNLHANVKSMNVEDELVGLLLVHLLEDSFAWGFKDTQKNVGRKNNNKTSHKVRMRRKPWLCRSFLLDL